MKAFNKTMTDLVEKAKSAEPVKQNIFMKMFSLLLIPVFTVLGLSAYLVWFMRWFILAFVGGAYFSGNWDVVTKFAHGMAHGVGLI